jgi:predicted phage terminase large subunit-like protein
MYKERDGTGEKWEKLIIPAIENWESFFEKRFPLVILKDMQKWNPSTFSTQYLQDPVSKESQEFHEEWFRYYKEEIKGWRIFTTCDPAFSKKDSADNSCIMTGMFKDMNLYILEYTFWKFNPAELQDKIIYHIKKYNPEKIGIEAYQAQTIISFNLRAELEKKGLYANIEEIKQTWDKETKIRKLIPLYRNWHIRHSNTMVELEHELKRFPRWKNDDIADTLQMLYSMYELHPNTKPFEGNLEIKYDQYWSPIYIWNNDTWQLR